MTLTLELPDLAATDAFGRRLGAALFPGAVIALNGQLGAGKTYLVRAIAVGLGVRDPSAVTSPTFGLIHEYPAYLPIYHFDAYRLSGPQEFLELGADEYLAGEGVCLIEWADRVSDVLPADHLRIDLVVTGENSRDLTLTAAGPKHSGLNGMVR